MCRERPYGSPRRGWKIHNTIWKMQTGRNIFVADVSSSFSIKYPRILVTVSCSAPQTSALITIEFIFKLLTSPLSLSPTSQKTQSASDFMFRSSTYPWTLALTSQITIMSCILCWDSQMFLRPYAVPHRKHILLQVSCLDKETFLRI